MYITALEIILKVNRCVATNTFMVYGFDRLTAKNTSPSKLKPAQILGLLKMKMF